MSLFPLKTSLSWILFLLDRFGIPFQNLDLKKHVRKGDSSENLTKEWFSTLSKAQIRALYDIYQVLPRQP